MATMNYNLTQTGQQVKDDLDSIDSGDLIYYTTVPGVNNSNTKIRIVVTSTDPVSPSAGYFYLITSPDASSATGTQFSFGDKRILKVIFDTETIDHLNWGDILIWSAGATTLTAPTISLSDSILTIVDEDGRATAFELSADGLWGCTIQASAPGAGATYNLDGLGLSSGIHQITVVATASGLSNSGPSNSVTYIVGQDIVLDQFEVPTSIYDIVFVYDA